MLKALSGLALALLIAQPAYAAPKVKVKLNYTMKAKAPDISDIAFVKELIKNGGKYYYMGTRSGLNGFLLLKGGQVQMFYVPKDKKSVLVGAMFTRDGGVVTSQQVNELAKRNKEVAAIFDGSAQQNIDVIRAGVSEGGVAELPANPEAVKTAGEKKRMPLMTASPGERLIMDLKASSGVLLGNTNAPELLMVVSPNCYFCKKTWDGLRKAVNNGKLQVRLIPIARNPQSDETRIAAQLLRSKEPLKAWEGYLAGNKNLLAGEPDKAAYRAIVANRTMTDRWNIIGTPYLVYRAKNKTIKIVQGKPERMAAVLADLIKE